MRLFRGIPVPPSPAYAEVTRELLETCPDARPVPDGSWHVTLRFFGELVGEGADLNEGMGPVVAAVRKAVQGHAVMPVTVHGVGAFQSPRRARVVWAGVAAPGLGALAADVLAGTAHLGAPPEPRDFRAHVTLARIREPADLSGWVRGYAERTLSEGVLDRVVLWRSVLGPEGPRYEVVETFPLQPSGDRTAVADKE